MKKTAVLFQQHAGRMFVQHWKVQRKRVLRDTGAIKTMKEMGFTVTDINDILIGTQPSRELLPCFKPAVSLDSHLVKEPCLTYRDHNVLLEGLVQAKVLTNTIELETGTLPLSLTNRFDSRETSSLNELAKRIIKSSLLYDAEQKKLPIRKDPERPAWIFPRDYGITEKRKNFLMCSRFLQLCSSLNPGVFSKRRILNDTIFSVPLKRNNRDVLLSLRAEPLVTSSTPLKPITDQNLTRHIDLPVLDPLLPIVSLEEENMFKPENSFVCQPGNYSSYIHTALVHYNVTEVKNLYETEVTESQILGRSLMKSFTFAASQARHMYGNETVDYPVPIVVQCIQSDSRHFHFSVFQLNTLREDGPIHNIFWSLPRISLFDTCDYVDGKPILEGYNPDVLKWILCFYNSK